MKGKPLGQLILERRKGFKITAESLAHKIGVDRTYISRMERHGWLPSLPLMKRIAKELKDKNLLLYYIAEKYPDVMEILSDSKMLSKKTFPK